MCPERDIEAGPILRQLLQKTNRNDQQRFQVDIIDCEFTSRRPRHDNTPLLQRRPLRQVRDEIGTVKQEISHALTLPQLAIDPCLQTQLFRIWDERPRHQTRPQRRKRVEALGEPPLRHAAGQRGIALQLACRDVVADGVGCDVGEGLVDRDVFCVAADDEALESQYQSSGCLSVETGSFTSSPS